MTVPKLIDLVGRKSGKLTVVAYSHRGTKEHYWKCSCECGGESVVRGSHIRDGSTTSCGSSADFHRPGQFKHGMSGSRLYRIWSGMMKRCYARKHVLSHRYMGRGIEVCQEWREDMNKFFVWATENGYRDGLSIDRIDNNGNYEPSNCRWASAAVQQRNMSRNVNYTINGITKCQAQWCRDLGISPSTIRRRLKAGITGENLLKKVGRFGRPIAS